MTNREQICRNEAIRDDLKAYLDGELPALRRLAVGFHLTRCEECRREIDIMENISESLVRSAEEGELPASLKTRILDNAPASEPGFVPGEAGGPRPVPAARPPLWRAWGGQLAALGACMCIALVLTTATMNRKVSTVFNMANSALNTSTTDGWEYRAGEPAEAPAAAPADRVASLQSNRASEWKIEAQRGGTFLDGNASQPGSLGGSAADVPSALRKVHKEGRIRVRVGKLEEATEEVTGLIKSVGGFVANNTLSTGDDGAKTANIEARVPVGSFETVLSQVARQGDVRAKNVTGEDITEKYSDAQQAAAVLNNDLNVSEARLKEALERAKKKRHSAQLPWEMRAEVRELRIRAAQARARLNIYRKISDLANISIQLEEKVKVPGEGGFMENISQSGSEAMQTFQVAARVPVNCVIWVLAYSPLWLPLLIGLRIVMLKTQRSA